eukprot:scaffold124499_cov17-Prasinocladus_malaysianus.AAC.1
MFAHGLLDVCKKARPHRLRSVPAIFKWNVPDCPAGRLLHPCIACMGVHGLLDVRQKAKPPRLYPVGFICVGCVDDCPAGRPLHPCVACM